MTYREPARTAARSLESPAPGVPQNGTAGTPSPAEPQELQKRREFAKCMRENGVEDFPDPDANGFILYYGDDPDMESASEKCDDRQPRDRVREPGHGG
jgi:hypothetical protein